jgi:hypothetical protein
MHGSGEYVWFHYPCRGAVNAASCSLPPPVPCRWWYLAPRGDVEIIYHDTARLSWWLEYESFTVDVSDRASPQLCSSKADRTDLSHWKLAVSRWKRVFMMPQSSQGTFASAWVIHDDAYDRNVRL